MKEYIAAGEFVTTHGILGELKLYPWCDSAEFVCKLPRLFMKGDGTQCVRIMSARVHKNMCLLMIEGVSSVETARAFIGKTAYLARKDAKLPKGRYFVDDIIGSEVKDADSGKIYGKITDITRPAAQDIYTVENDKGEVFLFPAVPEFLVSLEPENAIVTVRPIEGMFTVGGKSDDED
ncbi:MAG: ribosome maturation factor RimM [Oscillospiraceae bacterium]